MTDHLVPYRVGMDYGPVTTGQATESGLEQQPTSTQQLSRRYIT
jgi:hypothetical protein